MVPESHVLDAGLCVIACRHFSSGDVARVAVGSEGLISDVLPSALGIGSGKSVDDEAGVAMGPVS